MTIIYSNQIQDDLFDLEMFVLSNNGSKVTVTDIVKKIKSSVEDLEMFPCRHKVWDNTEYRFFNVSNYLVFYRFDEAAEKIIIERVIYSRRNIEDLL